MADLERRERLVPQSIDINWIASKQTLARGIGDLHEEEKARDPIFRLRLHHIERGHLGGFLYDLGHTGRGMEGFPRMLPLEVASLAPREGSRIVEASVPIGSLVAQIGRAAGSFLRSQPDDQSQLSHVSVLDYLSEQVAKRTAQLLNNCIGNICIVLQ